MRYQLRWKAPYGRKGTIEFYSTDLEGMLTRLRKKLHEGPEMRGLKTDLNKIKFVSVEEFDGKTDKGIRVYGRGIANPVSNRRKSVAPHRLLFGRRSQAEKTGTSLAGAS